MQPILLQEQPKHHQDHNLVTENSDSMLHRTHLDWDYDDESSTSSDHAHDAEAPAKPIVNNSSIDQDGDFNDESGSTWSAYFSSSGSAAKSNEQEHSASVSDEGNQLLWNINEMFNFNFRVVSPVEDEHAISMLDEDARKLMYSSDEQTEVLHKSRIRSILTRFLGLETPRLSGQLMEFLLLEENLNLFVSLITRVDPAEGYKFDWEGFCLTPLDLLIPSLNINREMENDEVHRLSFNALNVLCGTAASNIRLLDVKIRDIVIRIFDSFHPASQANFHHCNKLLSNLLQRDPNTVLDTLLMPTVSSTLPDLEENKDGEIDEEKILNSIKYVKPLIFRCLPYVVSPPVADLMYTILSKKIMPEETDDEDTKRIIFDSQKRRFEELSRFQFIETLLGFILIDKNQDMLHDHIVAASDFLVRFTEEACDIDFGSVLYSSLRANGSYYETMLQCLEDNLSSTYPEFQRKIVLEVFYTLAIKTLSKPLRLASIAQLKLDPSAILDTTSKLENISLSAINHCTSHLEQICTFIKKGIFVDSVDSIKYSSFVVNNPITISRIFMLEVFVEIVRRNLETADFMEKLPVSMWKLLADWLFDFPHNNTFHNLFFKIFVMVLKSEHKPTIKQLLTRQRLLQRSIEAFEQKELAGLRGHILMILNYIRLFADTQDASEYIPQVLSSSEEWKAFLPTLQKQTLKQMFRSPVATVYAEIDFAALGVGSDYALSIGFTREMPEHVNKEVVEDDASSTSSPAISKKKKTKRKKKKSDAVKLENDSSSPTETKAHDNEDNTEQSE